MSSCERCWADAHFGEGPRDTTIRYEALLRERSGPSACTAEQQAGTRAGFCDACNRFTLHQVTGQCMVTVHLHKVRP
jgi:hypothetical protein